MKNTHQNYNKTCFNRDQLRLFLETHVQLCEICHISKTGICLQKLCNNHIICVYCQTYEQKTPHFLHRLSNILQLHLDTQIYSSIIENYEQSIQSLTQNIKYLRQSMDDCRQIINDYENQSQPYDQEQYYHPELNGHYERQSQLTIDLELLQNSNGAIKNRFSQINPIIIKKQQLQKDLILQLDSINGDGNTTFKVLILLIQTQMQIKQQIIAQISSLKRISQPLFKHRFDELWDSRYMQSLKLLIQLFQKLQSELNDKSRYRFMSIKIEELKDKLQDLSNIRRVTISYANNNQLKKNIQQLDRLDMMINRLQIVNKSSHDITTNILKIIYRYAMKRSLRTLKIESKKQQQISNKHNRLFEAKSAQIHALQLTRFCYKQSFMKNQILNIL